MRPRDPNPCELTIDVEGLKFAVRLDGNENAPVLMLSNSLSSDMSMWDDQIALWGDRYRTVRYDQRGHGRTGVPSEGWSMDRLGRDALAIIDALGLKRVNWCGVSMGGMVGLWMAIHAPDRLDPLVAANTSAYMPPPSLWNDRIALAQTGGMEAVARPTIERWFPAVFRQTAPQTIERMRAMIERTPVGGYVGCSSCDPRHGLAPTARRHRHPNAGHRRIPRSSHHAGSRMRDRRPNLGRAAGGPRHGPYLERGAARPLLTTGRRFPPICLKPDRRKPLATCCESDVARRKLPLGRKRDNTNRSA